MTTAKKKKGSLRKPKYTNNVLECLTGFIVAVTYGESNALHIHFETRYTQSPIH